MKTEELGPSLLAAFARVPDVRSRHGRRYALSAVLTLATAAMLAGARSLYAIAQWGRLQPPEVRRALGFPEREMPGHTTLHYVFKRLDVVGFEAVLGEWARAVLGPAPPEPEAAEAPEQLVVDGKALRGLHGEELPGVRLVAVYAARAGLGDRRQRGVRTKEEQAATTEAREAAKAEAELGVAPRLLAQVQGMLAGRLVSADALYCQKTLCHQVTTAGGFYLWGVKANQPALLADITLLFTDPPLGEHFQSARPVNKHAGRLEERRLRASAALAGYLQEAGWVNAGVVLEVTTTVRWPAHPERAARQAVRYFLSSLPATAPAAVALAAVRRHGAIENRLHWPRDLTLGEDACRVRSGHAPQALAAVRKGVLALLAHAHLPNLAAALRTNAWSPPDVLLRLLGLSLS